jgi:hypothetical protein
VAAESGRAHAVLRLDTNLTPQHRDFAETIQTSADGPLTIDIRQRVADRCSPRRWNTKDTTDTTARFLFVSSDDISEPIKVPERRAALRCWMQESAVAG